MEKIKEILRNLSVDDIIIQGFKQNNIELTDTNLSHAGFGFHNISDNFDSTVIITKEVGQLIDKTRILQKQSNFEQPFAILGTLQIDEENNPIIMFDKFIEATHATKNKYSASLDEKMLVDINSFLKDNTMTNKVLLFGHTHPIVQNVIETNGEKRKIIKSLYGLNNNPLKLRGMGLNISVADIKQLVQVQEHLGWEYWCYKGFHYKMVNLIYYSMTGIQLSL